MQTVAVVLRDASLHAEPIILVLMIISPLMQPKKFELIHQSTSVCSYKKMLA